MHKVECFFFVNGDWRSYGNTTLDEPPKENDTLYFEEYNYTVVSVEENDNDGFNVYLD